MYHRIDRSAGRVRVVESYKDEMFSAVFVGALGLLALSVVGQDGAALAAGGGLTRGLLIGMAFGSVFLLSIAFSSGLGRMARGLGRGRVIEVDLRRGRYRRYQRQWFVRKIGAGWQPLPDPPQGARVVWKGARSQTALRLGQGRTFFFVTQPGEIGDEMDQRLVAALNQELAAQGVTSPEVNTPPERPRPTLRTRWRSAWEYLSVVFLVIIFVEFVRGVMMVTLVLEYLS
ncbi:MAG: hypothetical protein HY689_15050 [Chloroflexi bacterium]|nr:hypothetical protein [Chloroflexota bacterium]